MSIRNLFKVYRVMCDGHEVLVTMSKGTYDAVINEVDEVVKTIYETIRGRLPFEDLPSYTEARRNVGNGLPFTILGERKEP